MKWGSYLITDPYLLIHTNNGSEWTLL